MPLKVLSAGSMLHGLRQCIATASEEFADVQATTDHGHNIRHLVEDDTADADIVLLPEDMAQALQSAGKLGELLPIGTVGIGGVVRAGSYVPAIDTLADLKTALVAALKVLLTRAPTGEHLLGVISSLGIIDNVSPKLLRFDSSTKLNVHLAARTDNAIGFGPETEIRAGEGVTWIGGVPDEIQITLPYVAAILTSTKVPERADAFLKFLATETTRDIFRSTGVR